MQKRNINYAQAKGSEGGIYLPYPVTKEALVSRAVEPLSDTTALDLPLNPNTALIRISAVGGNVYLKFGTGVTKTSSVNASNVLTKGVGDIADGHTVTIGSNVYTFKTTPAEEYEVEVGASNEESLTNLKDAINGESSLTPKNEEVIAMDSDATTVTVAARKAGTEANSLATTATGGVLSWADTTLGGGTGASVTGVDAGYDAVIPGGDTIDLGKDDEVETISLISATTSINLLMVEY